MSPRNPIEPEVEGTLLTAPAAGDARAIIEVAQQAVRDLMIFDPAAPYVMVVPEGHQVEYLWPKELYVQAPPRAVGEATFHTADSFAAYVSKHARPAASTIWADLGNQRLVALLNDHEGGEVVGIDERPGWGDHRAVLLVQSTPEWKRWAAHHGQLGSQVAFAEHIEEGMLEIVEPDAAEMLEVAQTFRARKDVEFRQGTRLTSGEVQFHYVETLAASAGTKGNLTVPSRLVLLLRPFQGSETIEMVAHVRYRLREGDLTIGYQLERPEEALQSAFAAIVVDQVGALTGIEPFFGVPRR